MMQLSLAVGLLVPLHHHDAIEPGCWSTGPLHHNDVIEPGCWSTGPMYPTSLLWALQSVIGPCIEEAEDEIGLRDLWRKRDQVLCVCVCVWGGVYVCVCGGGCMCVYVHMSRKRWVRGGGRGRACKHLEWK